MGTRLQNKVALVFGAGSIGPGWGNGKATAVAYAREGAKVIAVDLNLEAARETAGIVGTEGTGGTGCCGSAGCSGAGFTSSTGAGSRCPTHPARNIASAVIKA